MIHSSAGRTVFYDKLIMATGSYPWIPPIKGAETVIASSIALLKILTPSNPAPAAANAAR
nr:nitrite reductase subunit NirD [Klebsiella pneumoniae]